MNVKGATREPLRIGVVGAGNIGQTYIQMLDRHEISRARLGGVAARSTTAVDMPDGTPLYSDYHELLDSGAIDAVLVATPTMLHPQMAKAAAERGVHMLIEKPLAMSVGQAQEVIDRIPAGVRCGVMLNQRFHPYYAKMRALLQEGAIGEISRVAWMMTAWYRPDVYYQVSSWRGTWPGEGGGLLINQCVHNLDVLQWLTGLPEQVSAIAGFGKFHGIDVEDEFTATLTYQSGATGVIVASSGEAPGVNQLDIVGDRGMLRFDGESLVVKTSEQSVSEHCATTSDMFGMPDYVEEVIDLTDAMGVSQHARVLQDFVDSVLDDAPLATSAEEGLGSLQLANAILLSAWEGASVGLPVDSARYESALQQRIASASLRTPSSQQVSVDMDKSYR